MVEEELPREYSNLKPIGSDTKIMEERLNEILGKIRL